MTVSWGSEFLHVTSAVQHRAVAVNPENSNRQRLPFVFSVSERALENILLTSRTTVYTVLYTDISNTWNVRGADMAMRRISASLGYTSSVWPTYTC